MGDFGRILALVEPLLPATRRDAEKTDLSCCALLYLAAAMITLNKVIIICE